MPLRRRLRHHEHRQVAIPNDGFRHAPADEPIDAVQAAGAHGDEIHALGARDADDCGRGLDVRQDVNFDGVCALPPQAVGDILQTMRWRHEWNNLE